MVKLDAPFPAVKGGGVVSGSGIFGNHKKCVTRISREPRDCDVDAGKIERPIGSRFETQERTVATRKSLLSNDVKTQTGPLRARLRSSTDRQVIFCSVHARYSVEFQIVSNEFYV